MPHDKALVAVCNVNEVGNWRSNIKHTFSVHQAGCSGTGLKCVCVSQDLNTSCLLLEPSHASVRETEILA